MSLMSEREALDLYEAVRYNLPNAKFKEAVDVAFCALVKQIVPDTNVVKTNADHIRSMTDEELAEFLMSDICGTVGPEDFDCYGACVDCAVIWLKQPYKDGGDK